MSVTVLWYPDTSSRFIENLLLRAFLLILGREREKFQPLLLRNICSLLHQIESGLLSVSMPSPFQRNVLLAFSYPFELFRDKVV